MKTLVVDDDSTDRLLLEQILKEYGPVETAANAIEALFAVRAALDSGTPFDLICLDIVMEELNGLQALSVIRKMEIESRISLARIVMITGRTDPATVMEAIKSQCDHYIAKPINKAILLEELAKVGLISAQ